MAFWLQNYSNNVEGKTQRKKENGAMDELSFFARVA
jgi:hypothetical protein